MIASKEGNPDTLITKEKKHEDAWNLWKVNRCHHYLAEIGFREKKEVEKKLKKTEAKSEEWRKKAENHKVAGTGYRQDAIKSMGVKNSDYTKTKKVLQMERRIDEWIYEYKFNPVKAELVPEPENPKDPNAIKVMVDGHHIGYIKAGSCAHIHKLLKDDRIESIACKIVGGKCKMLTRDEDGQLTLEKDDGPIGVRLTITTKPEN